MKIVLLIWYIYHVHITQVFQIEQIEVKRLPWFKNNHSVRTVAQTKVRLLLCWGSLNMLHICYWHDSIERLNLCSSSSTPLLHSPNNNPTFFFFFFESIILKKIQEGIHYIPQAYNCSHQIDKHEWIFHASHSSQSATSTVWGWTSITR